MACYLLSPPCFHRLICIFYTACPFSLPFLLPFPFSLRPLFRTLPPVPLALRFTFRPLLLSFAPSPPSSLRPLRTLLPPLFFFYHKHIFTIISNLSYVNNSNPFDLGFYPFISALPFIAYEILLLMYLMGYIHSFAVANIPIFICDLIIWFGVCVLFCAL